jgi:long-chain acyl-CoA synthetase
MTETPRTLVHLHRWRVAATPDAQAMACRTGTEWTWMTWRETEARVRDLAGGLLGLGLAPGERAAILSASRPEWVLADLAILWAGGATSTLYPSNTPEECAYILADCEAGLLRRERSPRRQAGGRAQPAAEAGEDHPLRRAAPLEELGGEWAVPSGLCGRRRRRNAAHPGALECGGRRPAEDLPP